MPETENYLGDDLLLLQPSSTDVVFNEADGDYIKVSIYDTDNLYLGLYFESNKDVYGNYLSLDLDELTMVPNQSGAEKQFHIYRNNQDQIFINPMRF